MILRVGLFWVILWNAVSLSGQSPDSLFLKSISISGNKRTRVSIITREITLKPDNRYSRADFESRIERSRQNLLNTSLFNFIDAEINYHGDTAELAFIVTERWYTWPSPIFELVDPNFNTWWETRDYSRTSYGLQLTQFNVRGRNESFRFRVKLGYNKQFSSAYEIPFLDRSRKFGIGIFWHYNQNYQVTYGTDQNKRLFYTDSSGLAREEFSTSVRFQYRRKNYGRHFFTVEHNRVKVKDTLNILAPDYLLSTDLTRKVIELRYQYSFDKRDYGVYPLQGSLYTFALTKPDIDLGKQHHNGILTTYGQVKKYFALNKTLFYAFSATGKHTFYKQFPYYFQRGLGYSDYIRGYEYYVIDAQSYVAFKSSFKVQLLKRREVKLDFVKNERFNRVFFAGYLNFNADAGYATDRFYAGRNALSNHLLLGGGVGLDVISFYDIIIRFEYSRNKIGESAFFLHFSKPI